MVQLLGIFGFLAVLIRGAILCSQTVAGGGVIFLSFISRRPNLLNDEFQASAWKMIRWSALILTVAQVLFVVANSLILTASADIPLAEVLGANYVYAGLLGMAGGLLLWFWPRVPGKPVSRATLIPVAMMLAATVMTSHSASRLEGRALLVSLTTIHYLTTASWIGGLPFLLLAMRRYPGTPERAQISARFSRMAQISVALLFAAGLAMSFVYVGGWDAVLGTAYGAMVATKVALFGCLLLLGAANYYIVKGLGEGKGEGAQSLVRFGEAEIGIGLAVILTATSLTSQPPGVDLTQDRVTMHEIATRYSPRLPRLSSPHLNEISESTKERLRRLQASGERVPVMFVQGQFAADTNKIADREWSEYNHNWAGLIVFLMGLLALLSRSKYFAWAKIWPLAFLGLAVFLFLRADPENWPLGPNGFWESFTEAEVLQHRLAVVLIIVFAVFQYMVETKRLKSHAAALVFPGVCIIGGMVLLTHTHALGNIKEELLAELSHTGLAFFGILAGWSRWLELRLPEQNQARRYLAWLWPLCFMMVGVILMDYHEL